MNRVGSDDGGFSVDFDSASATVVVVAWGFWSVEVAAAFDTTVRVECSKRRPAGGLALDMAELKPMRDEGQRAFVRLMSTLPALGIKQTTIKTTSQLTRLQVLRLIKEANASDSVRVT